MNGESWQSFDEQVDKFKFPKKFVEELFDGKNRREEDSNREPPQPTLPPLSHRHNRTLGIF